MERDPVRDVVRDRTARLTAWIVRILVVLVIVVAVFGQVVLQLWNWLMPKIFGLPAITFWQAVGLMVLSWLLFGGFRGGRSLRRGPRPSWRQRWESLTPEERERFRR